MPDYRPTSLDVLMRLVQAKVINDQVFEDPSLVRLSDDSDDDAAYYPVGPATGPQYVALVAGGAVISDPWEGPVRAFLSISQELIAVVWTRLGTDVAGRAEHMLTDPMGILYKCYQVIKSLHGYQVMDQDRNLYSDQPIVYQREDRAVRKRNNEEWSRRRIYFAMYYQCATGLPAVISGIGGI